MRPAITLARPAPLRARRIAAGYALVLAAVSLLNQVPGIVDADGRAFGVFALDLYDDLLHAGSAAWAALAAARSRRASVAFLALFGALYLADGLLGLATGAGYLDLGLLRWGVQPWDPVFRLLSNGPHLLLGGVALAAGLRAGRDGRG